MGYRFKMLGVHAATVLTNVIQLKPVRDRGYKQLVRDSVRPRARNGVQRTWVEVPISRRDFSSGPEPTAARGVLINPPPESLVERAVFVPVPGKPLQRMALDVAEIAAGALVKAVYPLPTSAFAEG
jgi:hypothetical protein